VAVDIYLNETTRHADVILPPTTALERDHYDLVFHALAVRDTARFTPAVLPKPDGTRHDWEIFRDLALGLLARSDRKAPLKKRLVTQGRLRLSPTRIVDLLLRTGSRKLSVRALRKEPNGVDLGPLAPSLPDRLQTKDKRIDLAPALVLDDLGRLLDGRPTPGPDELLLIGRRHQRDCNSWMHNTERLTKGRARHHLLMHPADLASRSLEDGAVVQVTSRVGKVDVEVKATEDVMQGVVSLPHGYGHGAPGTRLSHSNGVAGVSINDLTDPEALDVTGNAALNGVPATVTAS
jgi:anaerobic selenocysteine-containing dehydrogenase